MKQKTKFTRNVLISIALSFFGFLYFCVYMLALVVKAVSGGMQSHSETIIWMAFSIPGIFIFSLAIFIFTKSALREDDKRLANISLILSCLIILFGPLVFIPAVICGHVAKRRSIKNLDEDSAKRALISLRIAYCLFGIQVILYILGS